MIRLIPVRLSSSASVWLRIAGTKKTCVTPYASSDSARKRAPVISGILFSPLDALHLLLVRGERHEAAIAPRLPRRVVLQGHLVPGTAVESPHHSSAPEVRRQRIRRQALVEWAVARRVVCD